MAWEISIWRDPELFSILGLHCFSGEQCFCDVLRAAVGLDTGFAEKMSNVVDLLYFFPGPMDCGYVVHEYDRNAWLTQLLHLVCLLRCMGSMGISGGLDWQRQMFLHNFHYGFVRGGRF